MFQNENITFTNAAHKGEEEEAAAAAVVLVEVMREERARAMGAGGEQYRDKGTFIEFK